MLESVHVLIVIHQMPDSDCIGAALAFSMYLDTLKKKNRIFCKNKPGKQFDFLKKIKNISDDMNFFREKRFSHIVVLDCSDLHYAGVADFVPQLEWKPRPKIINLDHHVTNEYFGNLNLVDPFSSSTCQILYDFFRNNQVRIDKDMATALLSGVIGDTDSFSNPATTFSSLECASHLLKLGAHFFKVSNHSFKNKTVSSLRVWGKVLARLQLNPKLGIASTVITREDLSECGSSEETSLGITNFLNNLNGSKAVLVLKETGDGKIKGSLRTTRGNIDVSKIAKIFGGGGHKKAAGFSLAAKIQKNGKGWEVV